MNNLKSVIAYFLMFPSIFIGTLAMVSYGVTIEYLDSKHNNLANRNCFGVCFYH